MNYVLSFIIAVLLTLAATCIIIWQLISISVIKETNKINKSILELKKQCDLIIKKIDSKLVYGDNLPKKPLQSLIHDFSQPQKKQDDLQSSLATDDTEQILDIFLKANYLDKSYDILTTLKSLNKYLAETQTLKNQLVFLSKATEIYSINPKTLSELLETINSFLEKQEIALIAPSLKTVYSPQTMNKLKQLSGVNTVSRIIVFGISASNKVLIKPDVYVG